MKDNYGDWQSIETCNLKKFKNFKLTDRDKYLLTAFGVSCLMLVWLAWSLSKPVDIVTNEKTIITFEENNGSPYCTFNGKLWKARLDGICYSEDLK